MFEEFKDDQDASAEKIDEPKMLDFDTQGGDAALLHLISLIDVGIRKRLNFIGGPRAEKYRTCHRWLWPLKYAATFIYIFATQFEKPSWCVKIDDEFAANKEKAEEKYPGWDTNLCNDASETFTQVPTPKYGFPVMLPIQFACVLTLLGV